MIYAVHPSAVLKVWPQAKPCLDAAFEHSEQETAAMHLPLLLRDFEQLWHIHGAAWAITRVSEGKDGRFFQCMALAGQGMDSWLEPFVAAAEAWAKGHGCKRVLVAGRPGWRKALPGYRPTHITLTKEL